MRRRPFLRHYLRRRASGLALLALRLIHGSRPVPLSRLLALRRCFRTPDAFATPGEALVANGSALSDSLLARHLAEVELGAWSLDVGTLGFLMEQVAQQKPFLALEFGSGVSTVCLARAMARVRGRQAGRVLISFEQDERFATGTRSLLAELGLADLAEVITVPLEPTNIEGVETTCYALPGDLDRVPAGARADFVLIDGPAANGEARFSTLPLARGWLAPGARFFLDDALRDSELAVARAWARLPYLRLEGVHLFGKGLLCGRLASPDSL